MVWLVKDEFDLEILGKDDLLSWAMDFLMINRVVEVGKLKEVRKFYFRFLKIRIEVWKVLFV